MAGDGAALAAVRRGRGWVALLHATASDPLCELAALEPGEVVVVGRASSPPEPTGFGYRADLRVEHLWYEDKEVLRGGGVQVYTGDLPFGVGDRLRGDGELTRSEVGEDGFDYGNYLGTNSFTTNSSSTSPTPSATWLTSMLRSGWASTSRSYSLLVTRSRLTSDLRLCGVERERPA